MSTLKVDAIRHNSATSDAITTAADGTCTAKLTSIGGGGLSHRNKVINGAMTISQRGASFAAANNVFTLDRYKIFGSHNGAVTVTQSATSPDGFAKSLKVDVTTADTSIAAGQYIQLNHRIEAQDLQDLAYGTSAAKTITVSFYVRSNVTGNYSFAIQLPDNSNKQVSLVYTINSANTWERKTFSIAGDTSGGINDDNGNGFNIFWNLAIGTQYTSGTQRSAWHAYADADFAAGHAVNLLSSTSNEWHLTGVQIEVGDTATSFEHRSYGEELARCQRYFYSYIPSSSLWRDGYSEGNIYVKGQVSFPVTMRSNPSVTKVGTLTHSNNESGGDAASEAPTTSINEATSIVRSASTGRTYSFWSNLPNGVGFTFSAEL